MEFTELSKLNQKALTDYCDVLLNLRQMLQEKKKSPVVSYVIRVAIRGATSCVTRFRNSGVKSAQYISQAAKEQWKKGNKGNLVFEHVIPVSVLSSELTNNWDSWNKEVLRDFFLQYTVTAVITQAEDEKLDEMDLRMRMPDDFPGLKPEIDKFVRYKCAGIECEQR